MLVPLVLGFYLTFQGISLSSGTRTQSDWEKADTVYEFNATLINGTEISLKKYESLVLLIVNVASYCELTDQNYKELVELYNKLHDKRFRILAFPCNQFNNQEPDDNKTICEFAKKYNVKFDMFEKVNVNGDDALPLWKFLKSKKGGLLNDDIKWNFSKFIIDRSGVPVERFPAKESPLDMERTIDSYL